MACKVLPKLGFHKTSKEKRKSKIWASQNEVKIKFVFQIFLAHINSSKIRIPSKWELSFQVLCFPQTIPNHEKIDAKNMLFFNIDFLRFWTRFGGSWASNLEPSWQIWPQKIRTHAFLSHLKLKVF